MKRLFSLLGAMLLLTGAAAQPRVYDQENTGAKFALKKFVSPDKLPVIRSLPDALEGVKDFSDWVDARKAAGMAADHAAFQAAYKSAEAWPDKWNFGNEELSAKPAAQHNRQD